MKGAASFELLHKKVNDLSLASSPTKNALSAINTSSAAITAIVTGTAVPLPTKPYINGFTVNGSNTVFTVQNTGTYLVSYSINTTIAVGISASVNVNGAANSSLTRSPGVLVNTYSASAILTLTAGSTLQLTVSGLIVLTTLQSGAGASMNVVRIV